MRLLGRLLGYLFGSFYILVRDIFSKLKSNKNRFDVILILINFALFINF